MAGGWQQLPEPFDGGPPPPIPVHVITVFDNGDGTATMQFDSVIQNVDLPGVHITLNGGNVNNASQADAIEITISSNAYAGSGDPWAITGPVAWIQFVNGGTIAFPQSGTVS